jgi:hypothetical protein
MPITQQTSQPIDIPEIVPKSPPRHPAKIHFGSPERGFIQKFLEKKKERYENATPGIVPTKLRLSRGQTWSNGNTPQKIETNKLSNSLSTSHSSSILSTSLPTSSHTQHKWVHSRRSFGSDN